MSVYQIIKQWLEKNLNDRVVHVAVVPCFEEKKSGIAISITYSDGAFRAIGAPIAVNKLKRCLKCILKYFEKKGYRTRYIEAFNEYIVSPSSRGGSECARRYVHALYQADSQTARQAERGG